jgi:hypothetical protein
MSTKRSEITIADNGPGLPLGTIEGILDYAVRVSAENGEVLVRRRAIWVLRIRHHDDLPPANDRLGNAVEDIAGKAYAWPR